MLDSFARDRVSRLLRLSTLPRRRAARMLPSPNSFDGSLEEFAARYVVPNLPLPGTVEEFHHALDAYCQESDALFLVRELGEAERGHDYLTRIGDRLRIVDNAPAWAVHYALFHDLDVQAQPFARFIGGLPTSLFDAARVMDGSINSAGWHVAHIYQVKDGDTDFPRWSRQTLTWRFIRNIHPCNVFYVPLEDWQRSGGDARVIAYFAHLYEQRYAAVWPEFLALARAEALPYHSTFSQLRFAYSRNDAPRSATGISLSAHVAQVAGPRAASRARRRSIDVRSGAPAIGSRATDRPLVSYRHTRFCFKADQIEPLPMDGSFRVTTNVGTFQMTKAEFYRDFANVVRSRSYRAPGGYHYSVLPRRAELYRV